MILSSNVLIFFRASWKNNYKVSHFHDVKIMFWWGNLRETDHWGDPGVDGRIILTWIFRK